MVPLTKSKRNVSCWSQRYFLFPTIFTRAAYFIYIQNTVSNFFRLSSSIHFLSENLKERTMNTLHTVKWRKLQGLIQISNTLVSRLTDDTSFFISNFINGFSVPCVQFHNLACGSFQEFYHFQNYDFENFNLRTFFSSYLNSIHIHIYVLYTFL
jgi:hypothetical protein